jgi:hypothetical protein
MRFRWSAFFLLISGAVLLAAAAEEAPFLKRDDVIALVGGEEMLGLNEHGELELLLLRACPAPHLRFRDLAWEGDTVFEQHRDLNYPTLEQQLDTIGATVVIAQFGQMESLAGRDGLGAFVDALEKIADRLTANGKRRLVLVEPTGFEVTAIAPARLRNVDVNIYSDAIKQLAKRRGYLYAESAPLRVDLAATPDQTGAARALPEQPVITRDGVHLRPSALRIRAQSIAAALLARTMNAPVDAPSATDHRLGEIIAAKNRLWFHYRRPQNWAFLAGDRVSQPSSHDYRDPSKRWFPGEMEQFLPMIAGKEEELWKAAAASTR